MNTGLSFLLPADATERAARLRELRALATVFCGPGHPAARALTAAVANPAAADAALVEISRLPARLRRRVLATFGELVFGGRLDSKPRPALEQPHG